MNKLLKILFIIEFLLIFAIVTLSFIDNQKIPTAYVVKDIEKEDSHIKTNFKLLTKAVCEETSKNIRFSVHKKSEGFSNESGYIFCRDELFVKCDGKEYIVGENNLENFTVCNTKLNLSSFKVNGSITLTKS